MRARLVIPSLLVIAVLAVVFRGIPLAAVAYAIGSPTAPEARSLLDDGARAMQACQERTRTFHNCSPGHQELAVTSERRGSFTLTRTVNASFRQPGATFWIIGDRAGTLHRTCTRGPLCPTGAWEPAA